MQIKINVKNKIATAAEDYIIICGNSDYNIVFTFDDEWNKHEVKTARFGFTQNGVKKFVDVVFTDNACNMPVLSNVNTVEIGVYAGDLTTTTPCLLSCKKSILCDGGAPAEPEEDIYNQIINLCNEAVETANSVEERANNGEFNGKDGADGKDGEKGEQGEKGEKGDNYTLTEADKKEIAANIKIPTARLIRSITITEENVNKIFVSTDENGNTFNLTEMQVSITGAQTVEENNYIGIAESQHRLYTGVLTTVETFAAILFKKISNEKCLVVGCAQCKQGGYIFNIKSVSGALNTGEIKEFLFTTKTATTYFTVGTKIDIWGVDNEGV